ncbi:signal peptidase II [bacterium]|jgi:signal peptidase II|nr:signal peptidase II [bacterium]
MFKEKDSPEKGCDYIKDLNEKPVKISKRIILFLFIIVSVMLFDQVTKAVAVSWFEKTLPAYNPESILSIIIVKNTGAAFGIFKDIPFVRNIFIILSLAALSAVFFFRKSVFKGPFYFMLGISLFAGGTLGNMFDRISRGYVIDFIDVDIPDINIDVFNISLERWPAFNVADSCICIGTFLILVYLWKYEAKEPSLKGQ